AADRGRPVTEHHDQGAAERGRHLGRGAERGDRARLAVVAEDDLAGHQRGAPSATSGGSGSPPSGGGRRSTGSGRTRKNAPARVCQRNIRGMPSSSVPSPSHRSGLTPSQLTGGSSNAGSAMSFTDQMKMNASDRPPISGNSPTKTKFFRLVNR